MSAPTYDQARERYQQAYTHWRELQRQWVASWENGGSPGIPLVSALSLAERELRAVTGAMHRAAPPMRHRSPVPPHHTPDARRENILTHILAAVLAVFASLYFTR
jgi:hypothetical protein